MTVDAVAQSILRVFVHDAVGNTNAQETNVNGWCVINDKLEHAWSPWGIDVPFTANLEKT